ncbi:MAG: peptidyl-alpha-hydroxyglycine alpha-amidating lyase family protein [Woeseiaceae bacterium]|nr:peptidyl-alpha-hydroxyglycine alpha-amidating lyase family protein [Woeseiaceae bacterium]
MYRILTGAVLGAITVLLVLPSHAQEHPYRPVDGWAKLPDGREWGSTSAVFIGPDDTIWAAERCGQNSCIGKDDIDPVLQFDRDGNLLQSFGAGKFVWPHGIFVDDDSNVWITDARGEEGVRGHQVIKFDRRGRELMRLGKAGIAGDGPDEFNQPSDVLVAPDGSIFVADGHGSGGNNRIVKLDATGDFIMSWGTTGAEAGEFRDPHALAMDSLGRLYVGDRGNSRIQIFDQQGEHIATWTQFGRPSGLYIDHDDMLYSADSESHVVWSGNWGWKRGIRIGSVHDAWVRAFIPDPGQPDPQTGGTTAAEGVAVDSDGNIYGAEVGPQRLRKYERLRWVAPADDE